MVSIIKKRLKRVMPFLRANRASATPQKRNVWSIGIYMGETPYDFVSPENDGNPVLTSADVSDIPARLVADPFMLKVMDAWYMFFEVMPEQPRRGEIGLATSADGLKWSYQQIVLKEPFHLSYPYVFEWLD